MIRTFYHSIKSVGKKITSSLILFSVFLTLLLSLNFHIWGGGYKEGSLEDHVMEQETLIGESLILEESAHMRISGDMHSWQHFFHK